MINAIPGTTKKTILLKKILLLFLLISGISGYAVWGAPLVPFHPDESTYLYMSSDFERLFSQPLSLAYSGENIEDERQRYRLIDAPLTRYYLGLVRALSKVDAPTQDWDWSASWQENQSNGAVPQPKLLTTSRFAISLLFPICLLLIFLIGQEMHTFSTGILAVLLFGLHPLVLLHNRRLMAEGWLTLGILLAIWGALQARRRPWLVGIGLAIAFAAKHSALLLLPVGFVAVLAANLLEKNKSGKSIPQLSQFLGVFLILTILFNPVFWRNPLQAGLAAWQARTDLLTRQLVDSNQTSPSNPAHQVSMRLGTVVANLYLVPPAMYEVGNYRAETTESQEIYLNIPGHNLLRGPIGAGISLFLTLMGLIYSLRSFKTLTMRQKTAHGILWLAGCLLLFGSLALVPLPWQRYVVPLVPITTLWMAYGLTRNLIPR
jgi:4-amino-4-deoxy-L-arabinose transferase-like glycosyltransferase